MKITKIFMSAVLLSSFANANVTLEEVQKAIQTKGAKWTAGNTWVHEANSKVKANLMGEVPKPELEFTFFEGENSFRKKKEIPNHLDWRDVNGVNFMSPIKNQGSCGSCVAFASMGVLEGQVNIANKWPLNLDFSEQYLFACGGGACNRGWYTDSAASYLKKTGTVDEACMPYYSGATGEDVACSAACGNAADRTFKIKNYASVSSGYFSDTKVIMEAVTKGPLLARMNVYSDFMTYTGGVYEHVTGGLEGGHAIVIVGYDATEKYWIVKNSWGESWGEKGYFRIKMADKSGVGPGSISFEVAPTVGGEANLVNIQNRDLLKGNFKVLLETSLPQTQEVKLVLKGKTDTEFVALKVRGFDKYYVDLNTTKLEDGVYSFYAVAKDVNGKTKISQERKVSILNGKANVDVKLSSPANGSTLSGLQKLVFNINSSPVPIQKLQLRIKDKDGKITGGTNDSPGEVTYSTWRTNLKPNGEYEVYAVGIIGSDQFESNHIKVTLNNNQ